jgi:hypothetical protein
MDGAKALLTLFALGISLVWILVPFAIFAVRNLLREYWSSSAVPMNCLNTSAATAFPSRNPNRPSGARPEPRQPGSGRRLEGR